MLRKAAVIPALSQFAAFLAVLLIAALLPRPAVASEPSLSDAQRQQIIRDFLAERPWLHRALPRGKAGVRIEDAKIIPSEAELQQLVAQNGAAGKPGERVRITSVRFVHQTIVFEINGGPVKRKSWRDRISVGVGGAEVNPSSTDTTNEVYNGAQGSSVTLAINGDTASWNTIKIKAMLEPVLDFNAVTAAEAFQKSLPPKLAAAIKNHHPLVGMTREMVTYAMGRPPKRDRETEGGQEYEEWIYGTPPQDVQFIRFVGDKVVRIEEMKVSGEKLVRTQDEMADVGVLNASAHKQMPGAAANNEDDRQQAPTLLRPGESTQVPQQGSARDPNPSPTVIAPNGGAPPDPSQTGPQSQSPFPQSH